MGDQQQFYDTLPGVWYQDSSQILYGAQNMGWAGEMPNETDQTEAGDLDLSLANSDSLGPNTAMAGCQKYTDLPNNRGYSFADATYSQSGYSMPLNNCGYSFPGASHSGYTGPLNHYQYSYADASQFWTPPSRGYSHPGADQPGPLKGAYAYSSSGLSDIPEETQPQGAHPQGNVTYGNPPWGASYQQTLPLQTLPQPAFPEPGFPQQTAPQPNVQESVVPPETPQQPAIPESVIPLETPQQPATQEPVIPQQASPQSQEDSPRKRGRPRNGRAHDPKPAETEPPSVHDAWARAETAYKRLWRAQREVEELLRKAADGEARTSAERGELLDKAKQKQSPIGKNMLLYVQAVKKYNNLRKEVALGLPDSTLPPTIDAEAELARLQEKSAERQRKFVQDAQNAGAGGFNKAQKLWIARAERLVKEQENTVESCRQRDRVQAEGVALIEQQLREGFQI